MSQGRALNAEMSFRRKKESEKTDRKVPDRFIYFFVQKKNVPPTKISFKVMIL